LVGPLQDITAHFAVRALELTGTPVLLNGREIITPSATWMVEDACSGVRFFAACTALGCLYAYLMYQRWWKRVLFVALAAVVPVIANGLRVYFTVLIGETWGMHYATGTDHMVFGWQFFGTVLVLLLLFGWFFRDRLVASEEHGGHGTGAPCLC
jgi:exosortase